MIKLKDILNEAQVKYTQQLPSLSKDSDSYGYEGRLKSNILQVLNSKTLQNVEVVVSSNNMGRAEVEFLYNGNRYILDLNITNSGKVVYDVFKGTPNENPKHDSSSSGSMSSKELNTHIEKFISKFNIKQREEFTDNGKLAGWNWKNTELNLPALLLVTFNKLLK